MIQHDIDIPVDVQVVANALREACKKEFDAMWSFDVSWRFARAAIGALAAVPAAPVGGEGNRTGASASPSGWSAEPEPVPVSALTGEHPSRRWQPISTAPKDGTKVLLCFSPPFHDWLESGIVTGLWTNDVWWLSSIWASTTAHQLPTHWMPLPAPPASCDGSAEGGETQSGSTEGNSATPKGDAHV